MSRMRDILKKLDLLNQHHLSSLLLFSYLSIPLYIAKRLSFTSSLKLVIKIPELSLSLGYEVWTISILLVSVVGMSYAGILDQICRKSLSLALLAFLGSLITTSLFVRLWTGVFVLGALVTILLVWTEAALLSWVSEITVYRNVFLASRTVHVLAGQQLLQVFSLDYKSDAPFLGLLVIIGIGVGFALVFIPSSPAFYLDRDDIHRAKRELGKMIVLHDMNYGLAMGLRKEDTSEQNDLRQLDKMLIVLMICGSMFCYSSQLDPDSLPADAYQVLILLQMIGVVGVTVVLGMVTSKTVLKVLLTLQLTLIFTMLILQLCPDDAINPTFYQHLTTMLSVTGTFIKTITTQTILYITLRKTPVRCKHRVVSLVLGLLTFGDNVNQVLGSGSVFLLTNSVLLCFVVLPKLFGVSQFNTKKYIYRYIN